MSCAGSESIHISNNVARAKTGYLRRYNKGFFSDSWKEDFFVLYVDSTLAWFDNQNSYEPKGAVLLKDVCQFMAVGVTTQYIPKGPPKLPPRGELVNLLAVPKKCSRETEFVWILFPSQADLNSWMQAITTVLPPPPQPPQHQGATPSAPPPYGQQGPPPYPPQSQPYPPPPQQYPPPHGGYQHGAPRHPNAGYRGGYHGNQPQTVVINQGGNDYRRNSGGDFATGMLIGGALGYGMARPWGWGWGGYGYGYGGFGSGISINNHYDINNTNIENNVYQENNYDYGGGDYGGDFGGGDFGGGDFGGGDFGGGDFGGGDFDGGDCGGD